MLMAQRKQLRTSGHPDGQELLSRPVLQGIPSFGSGSVMLQSREQELAQYYYKNSQAEKSLRKSTKGHPVGKKAAKNKVEQNIYYINTKKSFGNPKGPAGKTPQEKKPQRLKALNHKPTLPSEYTDKRSYPQTTPRGSQSENCFIRPAEYSD